MNEITNSLQEKIMPYILPKLPFDYSALEPYMDAKTVEIHHDKHHATYTNKLNSALEKYPEYYDQPIEIILKDLNKIPEDARNAVRNHGGGYFHHTFWWDQLKVNPDGKPIGHIASAIIQTFGNYETFKEKMSAAALGVFGSGWAWLSKNLDGALHIHTTPNQDSPLSIGFIPLLTIDVWEHAYYLKYQNKRDDFVANFWNIVNWDVVENRFMS
jgi:superoxide dismutase, Fe-Mn family